VVGGALLCCGLYVKLALGWGVGVLFSIVGEGWIYWLVERW